MTVIYSQGNHFKAFQTIENLCACWRQPLEVDDFYPISKGFPVFGTGQPTLGGFDKVLEPILKKYGDEKIIYWANLRQEPVVYANGKPYTARDPEKYI